MDLTPDQMRRLGYAAIDRIVDSFATLPSQPVGRKGAPADLRSRLAVPFPEHGMAPEDALAILDRDVFPYCMNLKHPRFFAFVPSPSNFASVIGDLLTVGHNVFAGSWLGGSGAAALETVMIDWMAAKCGFTDEAEGLFLSGGSMANLTALAVARHHKLGDDFGDGTIYYSDQTHSSIDRALRVLGFAKRQIRRVPTDDGLRISLPALREMTTADPRPFCVVANAGTTSTGAVDPLNELADFCAERNLWLHADGAYGAATLLTARGRKALAGVERVDSLTLDPHKWLFQPLECGCLMVPNGRLLKETYAINPAYLEDIHRHQEEINFCDRGVQLTRYSRAVKLWFSLQVFGLAKFRAAINRGFELAEFAEADLRREGWEIVTPAQMAIVTFRHPLLDDKGHADLAEELTASGFAFLSTTVLGGRTALRLCTINPRTTDDDIRETIVRLTRLAGGI